MTVFEIDFPQYYETVLCYVVDQWDDTFSKYGLEEEEFENYGAFVLTEPNEPIQLVLKTDSRMDYIVHECVHVANYILGAHDVYYDTDEDEVLAHYVAYIFSEVMKNLLKTDFEFVI